MNARRLAVALAVVCAACTPAPPPSPVGSAPASPAPTTTSPSPATPPTASDAAAAADVEDLVASMAAFVHAEDRRNYLSLVDLSDPIFATEHTPLGGRVVRPAPGGRLRTPDRRRRGRRRRRDGQPHRHVERRGRPFRGRPSDRDVRRAVHARRGRGLALRRRGLGFDRGPALRHPRRAWPGGRDARHRRGAAAHLRPASRNALDHVPVPTSRSRSTTIRRRSSRIPC